MCIRLNENRLFIHLPMDTIEWCRPPNQCAYDCTFCCLLFIWDTFYFYVVAFYNWKKWTLKWKQTNKRKESIVASYKQYHIALDCVPHSMFIWCMKRFHGDGESEQKTVNSKHKSSVYAQIEADRVSVLYFARRQYGQNI